MRRIIVTGAPGTGKTSLLTALKDSFDVVPEPARPIIANHRAATGEPNFDGRPERFVDLLIQRSIEDFRKVRPETTTVFDRGLPDYVAYAMAGGIDSDQTLAAARQHRYDEPVFIAPPWAKIYTTDEMRLATFEQVERFHASLTWAYQELGYELIELAKADVRSRASFVKDLLSRI